jgi:hypothetical protein
LLFRIRKRRGPGRRDSGPRELAFPSNALERFGRALDAVLAIVAFGRKLAKDLVGAGGGRARDVARGKSDGRPDREFVLQRPLLLLECQHRAHGPAAQADSLICLGVYSTRRGKKASRLRHSKCAIFQDFQRDAGIMVVPPACCEAATAGPHVPRRRKHDPKRAALPCHHHEGMETSERKRPDPEAAAIGERLEGGRKAANVRSSRLRRYAVTSRRGWRGRRPAATAPPTPWRAGRLAR